MKQFLSFLLLNWQGRRFYKTSPGKQLYHLGVRLLAKIWLFFHPQVKIIGVVGSYGKTTTSQVIYRLLGGTKRAVVTDINLDTVYNLPLTILRLRRRHRWLVLEMGVDHRGEMEFHLGLVKPDILVFTGITPVHSEKNLLGSLKGIIREKGKAAKAVIEKKGRIIANGGDQKVKKMMESYPPRQIIFYSSRGKSDFSAAKIRITLLGTEFTLKEKGEKPLKIRGPFWGRAFVEAFLAAAAVAKIEGIEKKVLKWVAARFRPLKGRMSLERGPKGSLLFNDALRANPASVAAGLETISFFKKRRKIALLGEMGELGTSSQKEHRQVGKLIRKLAIDYFVAVGPRMKLAAEEARGGKTKIFKASNVKEAASILQEKIKIKKGDLLYLKGSLLKHMERILLLLKGEKVGCQVVSCPFYHPCYHCPYLRNGFSGKS